MTYKMGSDIASQIDHAVMQWEDEGGRPLPDDVEDYVIETCRTLPGAHVRHTHPGVLCDPAWCGTRAPGDNRPVVVSPLLRAVAEFLVH